MFFRESIRTSFSEDIHGSCMEQEVDLPLCRLFLDYLQDLSPGGISYLILPASCEKVARFTGLAVGSYSW